MVEKHLEKYSTSLVNQEMQIKTSLRFHLTPGRMAEIKTQETTSLGMMWRKRNTPQLLVGYQGITTTLEISPLIPQKTGHDTTREPCHTTPGHIPRGFPSM